MRLSDRFGGKVAQAIRELPVLDAERQRLDYEIIPVMVPMGKEMITTFAVALFLPTGPGDHVTHIDHVPDPYAPQPVISRIVAALYQKAREEADRNQVLLPSAASDSSVITPGGLILP